MVIVSWILFAGWSSHVSPQEKANGTISGRIYNAENNEPVPFAGIVVWGTNKGTVSDPEGNFTLTAVKPGYVKLRVSSVGYEEYISSEFLVTNAKNNFIEIPLQEVDIKIDELVIKASPFRRKDESPVSLRRIGISEIEKNPGGNRDISKVIQSFPGVSSTPAYRNDVVVRGGGPGENKFYLDGVEIPNLNHFSTQGSSGGAAGIINVDFVREVNFYSGAFPADKGNALSSILDFRQVDGNREKTRFRGTVGASDLALTLDGPIRNNTTYIFSARRSYLQLLFAALELPFLPAYNDFQFKVRTKINDRNEIILVGLGAIDQFRLNTDADKTPEQRYILSYLPVNEQWNYTVGAVFKHFRKLGYDTWVISRNYLNNTAYKYENNNERLPRTFNYSSGESENKFRFERHTETKNHFKYNFGINLEYALYTNNTFKKLYLSDTLTDIDYSTVSDMLNYGLFAQISKKYLNSRLILSAGIRFDGSTYSADMSNIIKNASPRISLSYRLNDRLNLNFNTGRYFQRPPYTALGFRNQQGDLVNRTNGIRYISADHLVGGIDYRPDDKSFISLEGFYKYYRNYPFSITDSVSLASKGADFGTYGDEALAPDAEGRAYGAEIFARWLDLEKFNIILSYTFVRSEFRNTLAESADVRYIPTSWDNRHIFNITAIREFKRNWQAGIKWKFIGAAPYTPYDYDKSSNKNAWDATGAPYPDYSRFNSLRLKPYHQLDVRIDKQYFFNKWSLMFYLDIQNLYNFKAYEPDRLVRESIVYPDKNDDSGTGTYNLIYVPSEGSGTILPTIGIMIEF